ncbi:MAG: HTH domain-containing protein [Roseovarius sp.]|nr:HTH domain-containing protein [Roseovarius sp.]
MTRSIRRFDIIQMLRSARGAVTARVLADELEVTPRTIYRDVAALQAMRVPVEGEAGVGYVLRAGFDSPPLIFTAEELEALYVAMALLHRTGDVGL